MKISNLLLVYLITFILLNLTSLGHAQSSSTVQVTAGVLDPVTITASSGIDFGSAILPGIPYSISRSDGGAARFAISAVGGNLVSIQFTLPQMLQHESGTDEMPISFAPDDASYSGDDNAVGTNTFDPNAEESALIGGTGADLYIRLGGTISPRNDQTAGQYSGDITLDLSYTEN